MRLAQPFKRPEVFTRTRRRVERVGSIDRAPSVQPLLGITLKVLSALAFTLMSAGVKQVSAGYPVGEIVFFRSAFAIVPLLVWLGWRRELVMPSEPPTSAVTCCAA